MKKSIVLTDMLDFKPYVDQTKVFRRYFSDENIELVAIYTSVLSFKGLFTLLFLPLKPITKKYINIGIKVRGISVLNFLCNYFSNKQSYETKADVLEITYKNIIIGDLVYDSYLRVRGVATVDLEDKYIHFLISLAITIIDYLEDLQDQVNIEKVVLSHAVYVQYGVIARYAAEKNIACYVTNNWGNRILKKISCDHYYQTNDHRFYSRDASQLISDEGILRAKEGLEGRLLGAIDSGISYMASSAYSAKPTELNLGNAKKTIIIFLHDFYDSPHIYRSMLFEDFWEWIVFSLSHVDYEKFNVLVKPHPNGLPGNLRIINTLRERFPKATFLSAGISNLSFTKSSVDYVVTVYGTLIHEFAYRGIQVIACGDNPQSSFEFFTEFKKRHDYHEFLTGKSFPNVEIEKERVLQFFYMHYLRLGDGKIVGQNDLIGCAPAIRKLDCYVSPTALIERDALVSLSKAFSSF